MKNSNAALFSLLIFVGITKICVCYRNCFCCIEKEGVQPQDFPKWFTRWTSKDYGLEFSEDTQRDRENLGKNDVQYESDINSVAADTVKHTIDEHFKKQKELKLPDFEIVRLDPIAFEFNNKKMLLILTNLKFENLTTYDKTNSIFKLKAFAEMGKYYITDNMYKEMTKNKYFKGRIEKDKRWFLQDRKDIDWLVHLSTKFTTNVGKDELKPIIVKSNFQIQPENNKEIVSTTDTSDTTVPLRARGRIELEIHDLSFELKLIVKHTEDALRKYFAENISTTNRVPDFNLNYDMSKIEIIKLIIDQSYNKDYAWVKEIVNEKEDVNSDHPGFENPPEEPFLLVSIPQGSYVEEHFNSIIRNIIADKPNIRQRMCVNLLSKMAWKVMKFISKIQLQYLLREVVHYDKKFNRKVEVDLPPKGILATAKSGLKILGKRLGFFGRTENEKPEYNALTVY